MFWTDAQQAYERLTETVVLYDGKPCLVSRIRLPMDYPDDGPSIKARCLVPVEGKKYAEKILCLDDEKFENFRNLPAVGWFNERATGQAVLLQRALTNTQRHGLNTRNTTLLNFYNLNKMGVLDGHDSSIGTVFWDQGFVDAAQEVFPSLESILRKQPKGSAIAYNSRYCVMRSDTGLRVLYRYKEPIGIFTGVDTLFLFGNKSFYVEEIQEDSCFTLNNILEF